MTNSYIACSPCETTCGGEAGVVCPPTPLSVRCQRGRGMFTAVAADVSLTCSLAGKPLHGASLCDDVSNAHSITSPLTGTVHWPLSKGGRRRLCCLFYIGNDGRSTFP